MNIIISNISTGEKMFAIECNEQSTLSQSLIFPFERYDIDRQRLRDWINQKKEGHSLTTIEGSKYMAILIP